MRFVKDLDETFRILRECYGGSVSLVAEKDSKPAKRLGGVFPNEEAFQRIYDEFLENSTTASEDIMNSNAHMRDAFESYLCAIQEDMFRRAYQYGYEAAIAALEKGGAA